jgi:uroporphyrinogen decarboxylase
MKQDLFTVKVTPDWEGFMQCIQRRGAPKRVHYIELYLDGEVQDAICERFDLAADLDRADPFYPQRKQIILQRFLGYDFVGCGLEGLPMPTAGTQIEDTADLQRSGGRNFMEEHQGPITNWEEFERYPWPRLANANTRLLEWYTANLPDDMCIVGSGLFGHFAEYLAWLMGYETLCYALYDQRDLVRAIYERMLELSVPALELTLQFERVKVLWGSDDMGFRTGTLISPADLREFVLPGHKRMAAMCHQAGRCYIMHSCGNLDTILDDLIDDVRIDGRHSFEDTIEPVTKAKQRYGHRTAILGGIDLDFICRASQQQVRERVRRTLEICQPSGGYLLGTGNSVANYLPLDNYLAMLDEGRRYGRDQ